MIIYLDIYKFPIFSNNRSQLVHQIKFKTNIFLSFNLKQLQISLKQELHNCVFLTEFNS